MLGQIFCFVFRFNVRVFDHIVETECLVCCDDDLLIYIVRGKKSRNERQRYYIFFAECGQLLQLRLTMLYMYVEDAI